MERLKTKDLIYAGGYAVLYMIVALVSSTVLGFIPFLAIYGFQVLVGVCCACIYLLFAMKVGKFGGITIFTLLIGLMGVGTGHVYTLILALPLGLVVDCICLLGKYKSKMMYYISYVVFNLFSVTPSLNFYLAKEEAVQMCAEYYGQDYAEAIPLLITHYMIPVQIILAIIGGVLGVLFANKMMKKHFEKTGICK